MKQHQCIQNVFRYLAVRDSLPSKADIAIGFGHFDEKIPRTCGELYTRGVVSRILFTGGVGAGTADIPGAEADYFFSYLKKHFPGVQERAVFIENRSTNTGENVSFSAAMLAALQPPLRFGRELQSAILVANAYRQRRVFLTVSHLVTGTTLYNCPPKTTLNAECALFQSKGEDLAALLPGEIDRIVTYGERGYSARETIPEDILSCVARVRNP